MSKLRIFNTLSRKKEVFTPIKKGRAGIYTCGLTVYNYAHIGNLRAYIFSDTLRRVLRYDGYTVQHIMNITDVGHLSGDDDTGVEKIEKGAQREGKTVWDVARFYTREFLKDMKELNLLSPTKIPKATEHIKEQIAIIKKLEKKGYTYETSSAIYFDVSKFPNYTKLSGQRLEDKKIAVREDVIEDKEKRNPQDFALWFKLVGRFKNHVMRWPSPWGPGFPGWHIECSAMSTKYLGQPFDIHTGGVDHINVHHTNEIAQSEAAYSKPLVHYWMHNEFLLVGEEKMAKSKQNFFTLRDITARGFSPMAFRYLCLNTHYRQKLNFTWESLEGAQNSYDNLIHEIATVTQCKLPSKGRTIDALIAPLMNSFRSAVNDDLNLPQALASLYAFLHEISKLRMNSELSKKEVGRAYKTILTLDDILGLKIKTALTIPLKIKKMARERELSRINKQFMKSDDLRNQIEKLGYRIDDTRHGFIVWRKQQNSRRKI